jgi:D-alanine-D-alanine ligase-like ATP-grasp enzyme
MKIVLLEPVEPDSSAAKKLNRIHDLLEIKGYKVLRQAADKTMFASVLKHNPDVVFNLASIYGWERTNLIPAILEIAGARYTGSNLLSLSLARNYTKRFPLLLASGVPMAAFVVVRAGNAAIPDGFHFPLTLYCDGVYDEIVINNQAELNKAINNFPASEDLVMQEVVTGEKTSIYILDSAPFLSTDHSELFDYASKAYQLLEARGLARFDFVNSGSVYLDEIDLSPDPMDENLLSLAADQGVDEIEILQLLLEHAGSDLPVPLSPVSSRSRK